MTNVAELKKRMSSGPQQAGELPMLFKGLQKQVVHMQQLVKEQAVTSRRQVNLSDIQLKTLERIHDRLDAVIVESRVTNVLLSDLVAIHQTVITESTDEARDTIRNDAYYRVQNAE